MGLDAILGIGGKIIDRLWPDQSARDQARLALMEMAQKGELAEFAGRVEVVKAEAQSEAWLASNWRPITMLTFVGLIVARWFGLTVPGITPELEIQLLELIKIGLGGYVVGRSAEKIVPQIAEIMRK